MKIQVGQKLSFNNKAWGFVNHKGKRLEVYSIEDKKVVGFTLTKAQLEGIFQTSVRVHKLGICGETLKHLAEKEKAVKDKVGSLKFGQQFIGTDGQSYFYLKHTAKKSLFLCSKW